MFTPEINFPSNGKFVESANKTNAIHRSIPRELSKSK